MESLSKSPTGIRGLDQITLGGLPKGRPTLICGSAGCGKTLFAMEFLVRGAMDFSEPGIFVSFEENGKDLTANFRSLGFDLDDLIQQKKIKLDYIHIEKSQIEETGSYDLEGLFVRLDHAIKSIGAKRVVLDTIEALFSGFSDEAVLRAELRRLFRWLKDKEVTAIITGERGDKSYTRQGLEEYVSDCVILLDHRVIDQVSTRRLRVVKYRGSSHGSNEYPFLITSKGISVLPITSLALEHQAKEEHISSGIKELDVLLGGKGYFSASTILVSGGAGSGKTILGASFAASAAQQGKKVLFLSFEESPSQLARNMKSVGIDLSTPSKKGLLSCHSDRATAHGLEAHLVKIYDLVQDLKPQVVILDPLTGFSQAGTEMDIEAMLTRIIDHFKAEGITALFTSLGGRSEFERSSNVGVTSLIDTWIELRDVETVRRNERAISVIKSRGMGHSRDTRPYVISSHGMLIAKAAAKTGARV